ncbi:MAG: exonuclease SbcCD subunit D [Solirubrobacteraceae bacterium]|nr:exonuclease SbcCD subunit D [Solirubrobacteraceae bacterium]
MRILHTADWHVGRTFHRADLHEAQAAALDALVALAQEHRPDAILVAGDLFDRAIPPVAAVELACGALARLARVAPVLAITGNHDSPGRLGPFARLIEAAGVHLRSGVDDVNRPLVLEDEHGPVALYGVPYLEPDVTHEALGAGERSHAAVLGAAMDRVRADAAGRDGTARIVVTAHAFVHGGQVSPSERDITVGGAAEVAASTFSGVDYLALGHLHQPHAVAPGARYAGSPVAYSFVEGRIPRSAVLVELGAPGEPVTERLLPLPTWRATAELRGRLADLLDDPAHDALADRWLRVTLTDDERPASPMERLRARFPHVLVLEHEPEGRPATRARTDYAARVRGVGDLEVAMRFVDDVRGRAADDAERDLLDRAVVAARREEPASRPTRKDADRGRVPVGAGDRPGR